MITVKGHHFILPFVLGMIGAYGSAHGWVISAVIVPYTSAVILVLFLAWCAWGNVKTQLNDSEAEKFKQYRLLSPEEKAELGYRKIAEQVKTETVTRGPQGDLQQIKFDWIPVSPVKFTTFARAILEGRSPRVRDWIGPGKLFSDDEFDQAIKKLIKLGYFEKSGTADNSPTRITDLGIKAFTDYMLETGSPFTIAPELMKRLQQAYPNDFDYPEPDQEQEVDQEPEPL